MKRKATHARADMLVIFAVHRRLAEELAFSVHLVILFFLGLSLSTTFYKLSNRVSIRLLALESHIDRSPHFPRSRLQICPISEIPPVGELNNLEDLTRRFSGSKRDG